MENTITKRATIRAFIAVYPDPVVTEHLEKLQSSLCGELSDADIRWARPEQLHLTLQFLGHFPPEQLTAYENAIEKVIDGKHSFNIAAEGLGCFPSEKRPRILWAGLTGEILPLQEIKKQLDDALSALGYEPEKRSFHPHITLARIGELKRKHLVILQEQLAAHRSIHFGRWQADEIRLMQSVLSPRGAKYVTLKNFPLNQI